MSFKNFNANNGTNNFTSSVGISFNSHSINGSDPVNSSKQIAGYSKVIADRVNALERANSDIQSLIEKVVEEQLKTVLVEKDLRNEFSILNSTPVKKTEPLCPDSITKMINYRGNLIIEDLEINYPELYLLRLIFYHLFLSLLIEHFWQNQ